MLRIATALVLVISLAACGGDAERDPAGASSGVGGAGAGSSGPTGSPGVGAGPTGSASGSGASGGSGSGDILDALAALPGVEVVEEESAYLGYRAFAMTIEQPADHADPGGLAFQQRVSLLHIDESAPFVLATTGYGFGGQYLDEPAQLLGANQLFVEHRFFATSIPEPADWSLLTIEQSAADFHHIVELLQPLYPAAWLGSGVSKGGMTSVYHRRFYPDDLVGTVAYVAPHSMGTSDPRYLDFVADVGDAGCREALAAWQVELLERREAMIERMVAQAPNVTYDLLGLDVAFETAVVEGAFTFWQYQTPDLCDIVPSPGASDDEVWEFLEIAAPTSFWSDSYTVFYEPYYWQAAVQLGYPAFGEAHLAGLLENPGNDVPATYVLPGPGKTPVFDPGSMPDVSAWMASEGERLMFIYGENDPYTAAAFDPAGAVDAHRFFEAGGNHAASILGLADADRQAALDALEAWTGVTPQALTPRASGKPDAARVAWLRGVQR
jgi:hypothetical protein